MPGQGIEREGRRGDLIVEVQVTVPEQLTPEQEEAMKKFAEAMDYKAGSAVVLSLRRRTCTCGSLAALGTTAYAARIGSSRLARSITPPPSTRAPS